MSRRHPSGSEKRARTATLVFRVFPEEKIAIEAAANRSGLTVGSYVRAKTLGGKPIRATHTPKVEWKILGLALSQLGRAGSNLNQLARAANTGGFSEAEQDLHQVLDELREARAGIMAALGPAFRR